MAAEVPNFKGGARNGKKYFEKAGRGTGIKESKKKRHHPAKGGS